MVEPLESQSRVSLVVPGENERKEREKMSRRKSPSLCAINETKLMSFTFLHVNNYM
jgi:hypothetical protein